MSKRSKDLSGHHLSQALALSIAAHALALFGLSVQPDSVHPPPILPATNPNAISPASKFNITLIEDIRSIQTDPNTAAITSSTTRSSTPTRIESSERHEPIFIPPSPLGQPEKSAPDVSALSMRGQSTRESTREPMATPNQTSRPIPAWLKGNAPSNDIRRSIAQTTYEKPVPRGPLDPLLTSPRKPRSELRPAKGNHYQTDDGSFIALTRPDGTVHFEDKPNFSAAINLDGTKRFLGAMLKPKTSPEVQSARQRAIDEGAIEPDPIVPIITGHFDVTDAVMRWAGQDPYAAAKLNFLKRTREQRAKIAIKNKRENLLDVARTTRKQLVRVFNKTDLSWEQKRAIYFELWDECSEHGTHAELKATEVVRATIIGFIRRKFPANSKQKYQAAEITRFNHQRESRATFRPYPEAR